MLYSKTVEDLLINAFTGESLARNRYTFFAKVADKEGYKEVRDVFLETAENEHEHAKLFYNHISEGNHITNSAYPYFIGSTADNLKFAADGEKDEWEHIYKTAAEISKEEGYEEVSALFRCIIEVEKHHDYRFRRLYEDIINDSMFKKDCQTQWMCKKCGYILISDSAPNECPCCKHPKGYFKQFCEKY